MAGVSGSAGAWRFLAGLALGFGASAAWSSLGRKRRLDPRILRALPRTQQAPMVVFVPGLLGSQLLRKDGSVAWLNLGNTFGHHDLSLPRELPFKASRDELYPGFLIGTGFITKMGQALLVVPALGLAYLVAAPTRLAARVAHLAASGAALVVGAGWWIAAVTLWPGSKPWTGGSTDGTVLDLAFGYNGLGRLFGSSPGNGGGPGGGMGGNTAVLRDLGWSTVGLDYSPASVEAARARGLSLVRGDARRLPFPDETFDLVLSTDAWEHVDDHEAAAEHYRAALALAEALGMRALAATVASCLPSPR